MNLATAMRISQDGAAFLLHGSLPFDVPGGRRGKPAVCLGDAAGLRVNSVPFSWADAHNDARFDPLTQSDLWQPVNPKPPLILIAEQAAQLKKRDGSIR